MFRRKKTRGGSTPENGSVVWHSNAPDGWPVLNAPPIGGDNDAAIALVFSGEFARALKQLPNCEAKLLGFAETVLSHRGVVHVPLLVGDKDERFAVFPLRGNDTEERARFWSASAALAERGYEAVYYSPEPLDETTSTEDLGTLSFTDFAVAEESGLPDGRWAMWWNTAEAEPRIGEFFDRLAQVYELSERVYSYLVGSLVHSLRDSDEPMQRVALPQEPMDIPMRGPEGRLCLVSVSAEKGLRFLFPEADQDVEYLLLFLASYAVLVASVRQTVEELNLPLDEVGSESPQQWCTLLIAALREAAAAGHSLTAIGMVG